LNQQTEPAVETIVPTLFECLQEHGRQQPDRTAIVQCRLDGTYIETTYADLARRARRFGNAFREYVPEGGIIPLALVRSADCVAAMFAALGTGRAFTCLTQKLRPPQMESVLAETGATVALVDGPGLMTLKGGITPDSPIAETRWWLVRDAAFGKIHQRFADKLGKVADVEEWDPNRFDDHLTPMACDDPSQVGCVLFTSGSTGRQKGVLISQKNMERCAEAEVDWYGLTGEDSLLGILTFAFDVGLNQLLSSMTVGCELVLLDSWFPKDLLRVAEERRITGISGVPAIWGDFLTYDKAFDTADKHRKLRYFTVSGGDLSPTHLEELPQIAPGAGIIKTYGQSEAFRAASLKPHEFEAKPKSVGRPFTGVNVHVVREDGTRADANETGEVVHTGLGMMLGYLSGEDPQNKRRKNPFFGPDDPSEWAIYTGDFGWLDDDGYVFLGGRRDDMLKIQGNRVYLSEVRDQLLNVDIVMQAEVVAIKEEDQTRLVAFVVLDADSNAQGKEIQIKLAARVPSYMIPELVVPTSQFPRTASGKHDRQALIVRAKELLGEKPPVATQPG